MFINSVMFGENEDLSSSGVEIGLAEFDALIIDCKGQVGLDIFGSFWENDFDDEFINSGVLQRGSKSGIEHIETRIVRVAEELIQGDIIAGVELSGPATEHGESRIEIEFNCGVILA